MQNHRKKKKKKNNSKKEGKKNKNKKKENKTNKKTQECKLPVNPIIKRKRYQKRIVEIKNKINMYKRRKKKYDSKQKQPKFGRFKNSQSHIITTV